MTDSTSKYIGNELSLFATALNWKRYLQQQLTPFIAGDVLEVGAGIGTNVKPFYNSMVTSWTSLEPDGELCREYREKQNAGVIPSSCVLLESTLGASSMERLFDSIIYIDVMEHIENDVAEFALAYSQLKPGGYLSILCPAHNYLFSPFDAAIGHYRRYDAKMYRLLSSHQPVILRYLDCVGMMSSLANRILLRQKYPTIQQINFWDSTIVRVSRVLDVLTFHRFGKSILGVWKKN